MILTAHELSVLAIFTAVTAVAALFVGAVCLHRQEMEIRDLRADVDEVVNWLGEAFGDEFGPDGGDDPDAPPPDDPDPAGAGQEPDTVIAHPADTWSRQQALLPRYTHIGQHRS